MQSYIIRKSFGPDRERREVARVEVDAEGKILYDLMIADTDVERILSQAQIAGGLYCSVTFGEEKDGVFSIGQKETFVKTTDADFLEALELNIKGGFVDRD